MKNFWRQLSIFLLLAFCATGIFVGCNSEASKPYFHTDMQNIELEIGEKESVTFTAKNTVVFIHIQDETIAKLIDNNSFVQGVSAGETKLTFENGKQETLFEVVIEVFEKQEENPDKDTGDNQDETDDNTPNDSKEKDELDKDKNNPSQDDPGTSGGDDEQNNGDEENNKGKEPEPIQPDFFAEYVEADIFNGSIDGDKIVLRKEKAYISFFQSKNCQKQNASFCIVSAKIVCGEEETDLEFFDNPIALPTTMENYLFVLNFEFKMLVDGTENCYTLEKTFSVSVQI